MSPRIVSAYEKLTALATKRGMSTLLVIAIGLPMGYEQVMIMRATRHRIENDAENEKNRAVAEVKNADAAIIKARSDEKFGMDFGKLVRVVQRMDKRMDSLGLPAADAPAIPVNPREQADAN